MIHKITIYTVFFTDFYDPPTWCAERISNYNACLKNRNNVNIDVYQGDVKQKKCGTLQLTDGLEQEDQIYKFICGVKGDTVLLSKSSVNIILAEIVIQGNGKFLVKN